MKEWLKDLEDVEGALLMGLVILAFALLLIFGVIKGVQNLLREAPVCECVEATP